MVRRTPPIAAFMVAPLWLAACSEGEAPTAASQREPYLLRSPAVEVAAGPVDRGPVSPDEVFARLDQIAPGFAGFYFDDESVLVINHTRTANGPVVEAVVRNRISAERVRRALSRTRVVDYSWSDLHQWMYNWTFNSPPAEMIVEYGIDEVSNRVEVVVTTETAADIVRRSWSALGFPAAALAVEVGPRPTLASGPTMTPTLEQYYRPIRWGLGIKVESPSGAANPCTIAANVTHGDFPGEMLFITNSHCTMDFATGFPGFGRLDGVIAGQPDLGTPIGIEVMDPPFTTAPDPLFGACQGSGGCRHADVAMFKYFSGSGYDNARALGEIQLTIGYGSTTVNPTGIYAIAYEVGLGSTPIYVGDVVERVGAAEGMARAKVSTTCSHTLYPGSVTEFWCQYAADNILLGEASNGGDSGSPVFANDTLSAYPGALYGILWGTELRFSPAFGIEKDLGVSIVFDAI